MLTDSEKKWLEERKVGMCCRCVHYYTDITDCGVGCQWIANKDFPMLQCFRFWAKHIGSCKACYLKHARLAVEAEMEKNNE